MEQLMDPGGEIVFDTSSGISMEEQQEILAGINAMTSGHRFTGRRLGGQSLGENSLVSEPFISDAKKKGFLFPLFVNIGALFFLVSGFVLLSLFQINNVQEIRRSGAVLGSTERKLIQEIRQETNQAARDELSRLGAEQERSNRAEAQMSGFYVTVNSQISDGRMAGAAGTLRAMRDFLDAPSLQGIRSLEARKQTHLAAISAMEKLVFMSNGQAQGESLMDLQARNTALEHMVEALEREVAAFTSVGTEQVRIISEYVAAIRELETLNANQQQTLNWRDSEIQSLRTEMIRQASELNNNITALKTQHEEELLRQANDYQRRMELAVEAAIRAFTGE